MTRKLRLFASASRIVLAARLDMRQRHPGWYGEVWVPETYSSGVVEGTTSGANR